MNRLRQVAAAAVLALQNARRWKWRLLTAALLLALSLALQSFYSGMIISSQESGAARTEALQTTYFDIMVQLPSATKTILDIDELPTPKYQRQILARGEKAWLAPVLSRFGSLELLALETDSAFFRFEAAAIQGRSIQSAGEVVLPSQEAARLGLQLGDTLAVAPLAVDDAAIIEMTLVGIYDSACQPAYTLIHRQDIQQLYPQLDANCFLADYDRQHSELVHLVEWMESVYPEAVLISDLLPEQMGRSLLQYIGQPSRGVLLLIYSFAFIGTFTIAFMTFLERRRELAVLKTLGFAQDQVIVCYSFEYALAGLSGLLCGNLLVVALSKQFDWLGALFPDKLLPSLLSGNLILLLLFTGSLIYPFLLARIASVDQLLFARVIPLRVQRINYLEKHLDQLLRERRENVRLLPLPMEDGKLAGICTKQIGDPVKQGEVIATRELQGGLLLQEYFSICDGTVADINSYGILAIKPDRDDAPFYPYPQSLLENAQRQAEAFQRGREEMRQQREQNDIRVQESGR